MSNKQLYKDLIKKKFKLFEDIMEDLTKRKEINSHTEQSSEDIQEIAKINVHLNESQKSLIEITDVLNHKIYIGPNSDIEERMKPLVQELFLAETAEDSQSSSPDIVKILGANYEAIDNIIDKCFIE
ncbi:MAG: hypothetical protein ACK4OM_05005 [Alphaproteobacteria bacterium]